MLWNVFSLMTAIFTQFGYGVQIRGRGLISASGYGPRYPFIHLGGEKHHHSKVFCPRTQHSAPARAKTWTIRSEVQNCPKACAILRTFKTLLVLYLLIWIVQTFWFLFWAIPYLLTVLAHVSGEFVSKLLMNTHGNCFQRSNKNHSNSLKPCLDMSF